MENWQTVTDPRFQLRFSYPAVTPQGNVVVIHEEQTSDFARIHLLSRDSQEVYFEVRRYRDLAPQTEYQRHRDALEKQFELEGFTITDLTDHRLGDLAAHQYSFRWDGKQRMAILIQHSSVTYRIFDDPVSPINVEILSTLELIA